MTDVLTEIRLAAAIESFRGRIYMLKEGRAIPLRLSRSGDKFSWGVTPEDDWLQAGGCQASPVFHFTFHSKTEDRLHVFIAGTGPKSAKKLGVSRNGYLGLYEYAEVKDYWKIEPLAWADDGLVCRLRDHQGHQVKAIPDTPHHRHSAISLLTVGEGEAQAFLIKRVLVEGQREGLPWVATRA